MEPSFHRGDVVRVKERKRYSSSYRCGFSDEMTELTGYTLTVDTIREAQPSTIVEKDDAHIYSLIGCSYDWASSMLEKAYPLFKIGDKVRIVRRTRDYRDYRFSFIDDMAAHAGEIFTIQDIIRPVNNGPSALKDDGYCYRLQEPLIFNWSSSMLERVTPEKEESLNPIESTPAIKIESSIDVLDFTHKRNHYNFNFSL